MYFVMLPSSFRTQHNFAKSKLMRLGDGRDVSSLVSIPGCKCVELLIKYLGLSLRDRCKDVSTWDTAVHFK